MHTVQKSLQPKFRASVSSAAGGGEEVVQVATKMTVQKEGRVCSLCDKCVGGGAWPWDSQSLLSRHVRYSNALYHPVLQAHRRTNLRVHTLLTPRNCHCALPLHTCGSSSRGWIILETIVAMALNR